MKRSRAYLIGLLILFVVALGAPFIIPGPNGKPLMSLDRVKRILGAEYPVAEQAEELQRKARQKAAEVGEKVRQQMKSDPAVKTAAPPESKPETLYKWRDKKGTWHFTNKPPPDGVDYKIVKWTGNDSKTP